MTREPSAAREKLLASAVRMLASRGYHGSGTTDMLNDAQVPSGVLYHHFGSKERLAVAAIAKVGAEVLIEFDTALSAPGGVVARCEAVLAGWERRLTDSDFTAGCPVAPTALEAAGRVPALQEAAAAVYRSWLNRLTETLVAEGHRPAHARHLAVSLLAAVEGALLLAQTLRSVEPLDTVRSALPRLLAAEGG